MKISTLPIGILSSYTRKQVMFSLALHPLYKELYKAHTRNIWRIDINHFGKNILKLGDVEVFGFDSSLKQIVTTAMRTEVYLRHGCGTAGMHLDHSGAYPFIRIYDMYVSSKNLRKLALLCSRQGIDDNGAYIKFHDKYAKLKMISAKANMKKGCGKYRPK